MLLRNSLKKGHSGFKKEKRSCLIPMANVQPWTRADGEIGRKGHLNTSGMFGNFNTEGFCFLSHLWQPCLHYTLQSCCTGGILSRFKLKINPKYQIMHHYISPLMILSITVDGETMNELHSLPGRCFIFNS